MRNVGKYKRQYFMPPVPSMKWAEKDHVEKAPIWCSVDLRDGNQALIVPMTLDQKLISSNCWLGSDLKKLKSDFLQLLRQNISF